MGKEQGCFFSKNNNIVFTNDFWKGVEIISPTESDIDIQSIKEIIVYNRSLFHKTFLNNYKFLSPGNYIELDLSKLNRNHKIVEKKYWEMKFEPDNNLILEEAVAKTEEIFSETFKLIRDKYSEDMKFGIGLSGGLDSRLIAFYAEKYNIDLVPYCVGEKYSLYPLKSNGYKVSKKIAEYFNFENFKFINHNKENYTTKLLNDIKYAPANPSNISIGCLSGLPDFDIMLNGEHGGVFFGEFDFEPILSYSNQTLHKYLLSFLCYPKMSNLILSIDEREKSFEKVKRYINNMNTNDRYEIFYKFFFEIYGSKSKVGFFETNYGFKKRYSPYLNPDFIEFFLKWDRKFQFNRLLQRKLFINYYTDLSKIEDERYDAPIFWYKDNPKNLFRKIYFSSKSFIFRPALRRSKWIKKSNEFKDIAKRSLNKNQDYLNEYFPEFNFKEYLKHNPRATATFIKMKIIIDLIIENGYKDIDNFLDNY